jgi:hypothetical protein
MRAERSVVGHDCEAGLESMIADRVRTMKLVTAFDAASGRVGAICARFATRYALASAEVRESRDDRSMGCLHATWVRRSVSGSDDLGSMICGMATMNE